MKIIPIGACKFLPVREDVRCCELCFCDIKCNEPDTLTKSTGYSKQSEVLYSSSIEIIYWILC